MMKRENRNQKPPNRNRSIICMLVLGCIILALLAVPVSAVKLKTPAQIYPPNNYHYYNQMGYFYIMCKPVPGATEFSFEIEKKNGSSWSPPINITVPYTVFSPEHSDTNYSYRWRVSAQNGNPTEKSSPSPWRTFDFIHTDGMKLATPTIVGPPTGMNFYHTPRVLIFEWKPVFGANQYAVLLQYYDPIVKIWVPLPVTTPIVDGGRSSFYRYRIDDSIPAPIQGRWSVIACDNTGTWLNSTPSAWRTFNFKN